MYKVEMENIGLREKATVSSPLAALLAYSMNCLKPLMNACFFQEDIYSSDDKAIVGGASLSGDRIIYNS